jgi:acetylornithine deacetylase
LDARVKTRRLSFPVMGSVVPRIHPGSRAGDPDGAECRRNELRHAASSRGDGATSFATAPFLVHEVPMPALESTSRESLAQRLLALCAADTTTGREDAGLEALRSALANLDATIDVDAVGPGRTNVLATFGVPPRVLFSTHLDTVPPYFAPSREGDVVHGRGACDAKGQIVAHLEVIRALLAAGRRDVAFLGVVGEETDSIGAQRAVDWLTGRSDCGEIELVIDGEPTGNRLATGQRGIEQVELECRGISCHSGTPERGHSAILDLVDWIVRLRATPSPSDPDLGPEVFNVGRIEGGGALNVVPDSARAHVMARTLPGSDFLARVTAVAPPRGKATRFHATPPLRFAPIEGLERVAVTFGSDAPRLAPLAKGGLVALIGPGDIDVAHTDHEHLRLAELEEGIARLHTLALRFTRPRTHGIQ